MSSPYIAAKPATTTEDTKVKANTLKPSTPVQEDTDSDSDSDSGSEALFLTNSQNIAGPDSDTESRPATPKKDTRRYGIIQAKDTRRHGYINTLKPPTAVQDSDSDSDSSAYLSLEDELDVEVGVATRVPIIRCPKPIHINRRRGVVTPPKIYTGALQAGAPKIPLRSKKRGKKQPPPLPSRNPYRVLYSPGSKGEKKLGSPPPPNTGMGKETVPPVPVISPVYMLPSRQEEDEVLTFPVNASKAKEELTILAPIAKQGRELRSSLLNEFFESSDSDFYDEDKDEEISGCQDDSEGSGKFTLRGENTTDKATTGPFDLFAANAPSVEGTFSYSRGASAQLCCKNEAAHHEHSAHLPLTRPKSSNFSDTAKEMRAMYERWFAAGCPKSPEYEVDMEAKRKEYDPSCEGARKAIYFEARWIFDNDTVTFRNPFLHDEETEAADKSLEEAVLLRDVSPKTIPMKGATGASKKAVAKALTDESTLGGSPNVLMRMPHIPEVDEPTSGSMSTATENNQGLITNPYGNNADVHMRGGGWTIVLSDDEDEDARDLLGVSDSDLEELSYPESPNLSSDDGEVPLYSPIQSPWHTSWSVRSISDIEKVVHNQQFIQAASELFDGLDVEGLLTSQRANGYQLSCHDDLKREPEVFNLDPHKPSSACYCSHCERHWGHRPISPMAHHDPRPWCHCLSCSRFRSNQKEKKHVADAVERQVGYYAKMRGLHDAEENKQKRIEGSMVKLQAGIKEAEAEEQERLEDLMKLMLEKENEDETLVQPTMWAGFQDWRQKHLHLPSPGT